MKQKQTRWIDIRKVLHIITHPSWVWALNAKCKYIELRVDTRDGRCTMKNRDGDSITLKELCRQVDDPREDLLSYSIPKEEFEAQIQKNISWVEAQGDNPNKKQIIDSLRATVRLHYPDPEPEIELGGMIRRI